MTICDDRKNGELFSKMIDVLTDIIYYNGGADNALEDDYVMERAMNLLIEIRGIYNA